MAASPPSDRPNHPLTAQDFMPRYNPEARRKSVEWAAGQSKLRISEREVARERPQPCARFEKDEHTRLVKLAEADMFGANRHPDAATVWSALTNTIKSYASGFVAIAPKPESAAIVAAWMRSPGINSYCVALRRLDDLAGFVMPDGPYVDIPKFGLVDMIIRLEAVEGPTAADALAAAKLLRTATIHRALARVFVERSAASGLADMLHTVYGGRILCNRLDTIAGRPRLRTT